MGDKLTALEAYIESMETIRDLLAKLNEYADDNGGIAPDAVTWANVGDANHAQELLTEAVVFILAQEA
jgi:hypothetical protein